MECKVFYSWQSDLPNSTNRGFIQNALEKVAKEIRKDDSIKVSPVIERDTQGIAGSPNIVTAIFDKIRECQIFVCDVSIINQSQEGRSTPNPNVLVELGYAIGLLGWERIILVMNSAYGAVESLPFDLRMHRVTSYYLSNGEDKSVVRKELERNLTAALRGILSKTDAALALSPELPSIAEQAIEAIENCQPNAPVLTRKYLAWLVEELDSLFPDYKQDRLDILLTAPDDPTQFLVSDFARFSEAIAVTSNFEIAKIVYEGFAPILERYEYPRDHNGLIDKSVHDFYRFLGHELFVSFFAPFISNNRWEIIPKLLIIEWEISNAYGFKSDIMAFTYVSKPCQKFNSIKQRENLDRISLHADVLNKRHSAEILVKTIPAKAFIEADFFLYLSIPHSQLGMRGWYPWSTVYLNRVPSYLTKSASNVFAQQLLSPLNVTNINTMRDRILERTSDLEKFNGHYWENILEEFNPQSIASRP